MVLEQFYLGCLAQASYLIGDPASGEAAVVDPRRDVQVYLEAAASRRLRIRHVFLTHFHADFLAGHLELSRATGAVIHMGSRARAEFPLVTHRDGEEIRLGAVRLRVLETPGHTPESICLLVFEGDAEVPTAVLTGDTLFLGAVGRPDLAASPGRTAEDLAGRLYDSLHGKLLLLPDSTLVYPGHGAGSLCGAGMSTETVSTLGEQRRTNPWLRPMPRAEFVREVTRDLPPAPAYFAYDADRNRQAHPLLEEVLPRELRPLSRDEVLRAQNAGHLVLDTRAADRFCAGHLTGSLFIGLEGSFASWAGTLIPPDRPLILVAEPGRERQAAVRLGRIGFDTVTGFLEGGIDAFPADDERLTGIPRLGPAELRAAMQDSPPAAVVDVRTHAERAEACIPGTLHVPLPELRERVAELPTDRPLVFHCRSGYRSVIAASLPELGGRRDVADLQGGILAWQAQETAT